MRWLVLLACWCAAGCGVLDEPGPALPGKPDPAVYGPPRAVARSQPRVAAPRLVPPGRAVARRLDAGAVGVMDPAGVVFVSPASLDIASDASLVGLRWASWGSERAVGRGTLRVLSCEPTCVSGGSRSLPARVVLSDVRVCAGRRYFGAAAVTVEGPLRPASYVRAPC
ncbi:MAG TPA: hypothetical protein VNS09_13020 [Solirubrobacter sp.]|nr:hypothetical protein [Solirubrobacter sp.]